MKITLSYNLAGLHEAAQFIWLKNPFVKDWPSKPTSVLDVMDQMIEMMRRIAAKNASAVIQERQLKSDVKDDWVSYAGIGGYYFIYELISDTDNEINISVSVLVDPAVSHPNVDHISEVIDM